MNQMTPNHIKKQRADQLLLSLGLFDSRAKAQVAIMAGLVSADGEIIRKPSQDISVNAKILAQSPHPYVSRGGVKLAHAIQHFNISAANKTCLDVGASTGGFCDVLLRDGAKHIYAVDTGREQFHYSLRTHPKITLMEAQDVRNLTMTQIPKPVELVVIDVSFISLSLVLPAALQFCASNADVIALIKPQFEVGKANIGKGGIVKDETLYESVFTRITAQLNELGWQPIEIIASPVTGGDGNREFLIAAKKSLTP
jgi:23S rRNA (cytidine1920-2'-O)/16S rRNA (cytidine1409-2'-O)-methyltransferase